MSKTNIDVDDELVASAMELFKISTKREAVDLALRRLVGGGPLAVDEQLALRGIGWEGDLDEMRADRFESWSRRAER